MSSIHMLDIYWCSKFRQVIWVKKEKEKEKEGHFKQNYTYSSSNGLRPFGKIELDYELGLD